MRKLSSARYRFFLARRAGGLNTRVPACLGGISIRDQASFVFNMSASLQAAALVQKPACIRGVIYVCLWQKKQQHFFLKCLKNLRSAKKERGGNDCFRNRASLANSSLLCNSCTGEAAALLRQRRVIERSRPEVI